MSEERSATRPRKIERIVVVGHDNEGSSRLFRRITSEIPATYLIVIGEGLYYKRSVMSSILKMLREASWMFVALRALQLLRYKLRGETMVKQARAMGMPVIHTHDINSEETTNKLKEFNPDLLISLFTMQIYKNASLSIPRFGCISSHPSLLPEYRGLEVFFWVLANDEKETGVSVFFLNERIDAGDVIKEEAVPITSETTVEGLYSTITDVGGRLLVEAVADIEEGKVTPIDTSHRKSSYYGMPDRAAYRRFRRLGKRFF